MNLFNKSRHRKFMAVLASLLAFSIIGAGQANADQTQIYGDDQIFLINGAPTFIYGGNTYRNGEIYYTVNNQILFQGNYGKLIAINHTDWVVDWSGSNTAGSTFLERADERLILNTTANSIEINFAGRTWSSFVGSPGPGNGPVSEMTALVTMGSDGLIYITYSNLLAGTQMQCTSQQSCVFGVNAPIRASNALRQDSAGTITEKSNVVTCTPGSYTFLNGGSTAEKANIQSYVYTLLVNGKAVSTLSSDGFKSVASHLFPTIAGNMAGTATLAGATWDLKGLSNYSASCQVYATQSGANMQSLTNTAYDALALAEQAAAAEKVRMSKEMISNWEMANQDMSAKYRNQRLASKP